jgi:hypothetical protein
MADPIFARPERLTVLLCSELIRNLNLPGAGTTRVTLDGSKRNEVFARLRHTLKDLSTNRCSDRTAVQIPFPDDLTFQHRDGNIT